MPTLVYFPVRGRAEAMRTLLTDQNITYEEVNAGPRENWVENWKPKMQFGQCPCYTDDDGFQLVQSNAILAYLGRKYDLYGSDIKQASILDMMNSAVEDLRGAYVRMIYQNYEAGKEPFIKELPEKLQPFENLLKPTKGYILGEKISWPMLARPGVQKRRQTDHFKNMPVNGNGKQ